MARSAGPLLAISSILMVVLVIIMIATHQESRGFGVLQLAIAISAFVAIVSSIVYGLKSNERKRKPHGGNRAQV
jgi:hypothetical protein